jgi:hypothetical protein
MENITIDQINGLIEQHHIPFFDTPFFRSYLNDKLQSYQMEENPYIEYVIFGKVFSVIVTTNQIHKVWSNVPIDYYRTHLSMLENCIETNFFDDPELVNWTRNNMNYATFFNLISQSFDKHDISNVNNLLRDTYNQMLKILQRGFNVERPERWRLKEFHDHVSNVYLEKTTQNVSFPEKSINEPYVENSYKVYQPNDTLTLAKWAARVHNCVASYADKVFQKRSEIVFVEENGTPKFTVEIDYGPLQKGTVMIKQIQESCRGMGQTNDEDRQRCQRMIERAVGLAR